MAEDELLAVHVLVEGRVQGVGFRYFVIQSVRDLAISGWVRNLSDGRVEILAEGKREDLEAMLQRVRKGPSASKVNRVVDEWEAASGAMSGFRMLPTAQSGR